MLVNLKMQNITVNAPILGLLGEKKGIWANGEPVKDTSLLPTIEKLDFQKESNSINYCVWDLAVLIIFLFIMG